MSERPRQLDEQLNSPASEYGVHYIVGTHNQDRTLLVPRMPPNQFGIQSLYAAIDGHGKDGELAAELIRDRLQEILTDRTLPPNENPFVHAYNITHQEIVGRYGNNPGAVGVVLAGVEYQDNFLWTGMYVGDPTVLIKRSDTDIWRWPRSISQGAARFSRDELVQLKAQVNDQDHPRKRWTAMKNFWGHDDLSDIADRSPKLFSLSGDNEIILASDSVGERLSDGTEDPDAVMARVVNARHDYAQKAEGLATYTRGQEDIRVEREKQEVAEGKRESIHGQDDITVIYLPSRSV